MLFGDDATAVAVIDRLVQHAESLSPKGDSYRLKKHNLRARPAEQALWIDHPLEGGNFQPDHGVNFGAASTMPEDTKGGARRYGLLPVQAT